jgi:hypothetical protein
MVTALGNQQTEPGLQANWQFFRRVVKWGGGGV